MFFGEYGKLKWFWRYVDGVKDFVSCFGDYLCDWFCVIFYVDFWKLIDWGLFIVVVYFYGDWLVRKLSVIVFGNVGELWLIFECDCLWMFIEFCDIVFVFMF